MNGTILPMTELGGNSNAVVLAQVEDASNSDASLVIKIETNISESYEEREFSIELVNGGYISINNNVPIKVFGVVAGSARDEDVEIVNESINANIGMLCLVKDVDFAEKSQFTDEREACFIIETEGDSNRATESKFKFDYVVIKKNHLESYLSDFMHTSELWGGFTHKEQSSFSRKEVDNIKLVHGLQIPSEAHRNSLLTSIYSHNSISRYLKLYHQIELSFDWVFVQSVKCLNSELIGFGQLVKNYSNSEYNSIKDMILNYTYDFKRICDKLQIPTEHQAISKSIFHDYSKESNPIKEKWDESMDFLDSTLHSATELHSKKLIQKNDQLLYEAWVSKLAAYWIYRVRCSIAHNKIGEFIIGDEHEKFIIEFAEPLIMEVLFQIFDKRNKPLP